MTLASLPSGVPVGNGLAEDVARGDLGILNFSISILAWVPFRLRRS